MQQGGVSWLDVLFSEKDYLDDWLARKAYTYATNRDFLISAMTSSPDTISSHVVNKGPGELFFFSRDICQHSFL